MTTLFPDLLRAVVTDIMLVLLLSTMATPKYKSKFLYVVVTAVILVANVGADYYFYLSENYTAVFYVDLAMLIVIGIVGVFQIKPATTVVGIGRTKIDGAVVGGIVAPTKSYTPPVDQHFDFNFDNTACRKIERQCRS